MGYTVCSIDDDEGHLGSGLTLTEAFARVMALSHCEYIFYRIDGVMHLEILHFDGVPEAWLADPKFRRAYQPEYTSKLTDDAMARADIMRMVTCSTFKTFYVVTDEYYRQEEAKGRKDSAGSRMPA